jgi:hypothetical protein
VAVLSFLKKKAKDKLFKKVGLVLIASLDKIIEAPIGNNPELNQVPEEVHAAAVVVRGWWETVRPK